MGWVRGRPAEEDRDPVTLRDWTDPGDGRHWTVWLERAKTPVMSFKSERELYTVLLDSNPGLEGLEDRSDEELQRWLDEGRG